MVKVCAAVGCKVNGGKECRAKGITFHKFPKEKYMRQKWLIRVRRINPDTKTLWQPKCSYLCSQHFTAECFCGGEKRRKLRRYAEPTIFPSDDLTKNTSKKRMTATPIMVDVPPLAPPPAPPKEHVPSPELQIKNVQQEHDYACHSKHVGPDKPEDCQRIEIANLQSQLEAKRKELRVLKKRLKRREESLATVTNKLVEMMLICDDEKAELTKAFSRLQLDLCGATDKHPATFSEDVREFATTLYIYSPKAYEFVRKHFCLPHPRTLRRWFTEPNQQPALSQQMFDNLATEIAERGFEVETLQCSD